MQMTNMAELITVARYWKQWADPHWICMVLDNDDPNEVTLEQRVMEGDPNEGSEITNTPRQVPGAVIPGGNN